MDNYMVSKSKVSNIKIENTKSAEFPTVSSLTLYTNQNIITGSVDLMVSVGNLLISYNLNIVYRLYKTNLFIGESLISIPLTQSGVPNIATFPYKSEDLNGTTRDFTFLIPILSLGERQNICNDLLYIAANASVAKLVLLVVLIGKKLFGMKQIN
ncbi:MAG: hypothetical protein A2046_09685 [Bacteroidetes bacterium GWA2_30_7]|nr:MAG: hypothetical protein A2046_09685 [Bacteroidetes bacterium GWA2_30_7]